MQLGVSNTIIAIVFEFVDNEDFETFNIKIDTMAEELETPKFLERPCRAYIWQFLLFWHRKGINIKNLIQFKITMKHSLWYMTEILKTTKVLSM